MIEQTKKKIKDGATAVATISAVAGGVGAVAWFSQVSDWVERHGVSLVFLFVLLWFIYSASRAVWKFISSPDGPLAAFVDSQRKLVDETRATIAIACPALKAIDNSIKQNSELIKNNIELANEIFLLVQGTIKRLEEDARKSKED